MQSYTRSKNCWSVTFFDEVRLSDIELVFVFVNLDCCWSGRPNETDASFIGSQLNRPLTTNRIRRVKYSGSGQTAEK